jgi:hypothetical protein
VNALSQIAQVVVVLMLCSCAGPEVGGNYLLNQTDAEQIQQLVSARDDVLKPIVRIWADRPDHVFVDCGRVSSVGDQSTEVQLTKRHGRWQIMSVQQERILVTGS